MCTLKEIEMVERHSTQRSWAIPESLIQMVEDKKFLAVQAHAYGLCNLLSAGGAGRQCLVLNNMIQYYSNCKFSGIRRFTCKSGILSCMQVHSHGHQTDSLD